ncbi:hypothetical protein G4B88_013335 [Cannabis sativa]|uniref:Disease resistance R13L4/SHOC-2-like LRR domain-containing protein n=1 Tax=Cannabis sativa TaxID=3483 RepID=A0A7J6E264_CANSA|nr:hypothetical protein G4B88_013335 [Cannabis sativa]
MVGGRKSLQVLHDRWSEDNNSGLWRTLWQFKISPRPSVEGMFWVFTNTNPVKRKRKADMEKILERLNTFKEERYILDLRTNVEKIQSQRSPSMSSIDDAEFFATRLRTFLPINKNSFFSDALLQNELKELVKLKRLRFLSLEGYKNVKELPKSIGELRHLRHLDLSFTSIKELPKSLVFPPLGQLPALLTLSIEACDSVETVGLDFYGTSFSKPFPLLESLTFEKMMIWKEWSTPKEAFPKLKSLAIIGPYSTAPLSLRKFKIPTYKTA